MVLVLKNDQMEGLLPVTEEIDAIEQAFRELGEEIAMTVRCDDYDTKAIDMPRLFEKIEKSSRKNADRLAQPGQPTDFLGAAAFDRYRLGWCR